MIFPFCYYLAWECTGFWHFLSHFWLLFFFHRCYKIYIWGNCGCRYSYESVPSIPQIPLYFTEKYLDVKRVLAKTFFGPPNEGVYSASVQSTLYHMAKAVINRSLLLLNNITQKFYHLLLSLIDFLFGNLLIEIYFLNNCSFPDISAVHLEMPNIHFLPANISSKDNTIVKVMYPSDCVDPHWKLDQNFMDFLSFPFLDIIFTFVCAHVCTFFYLSLLIIIFVGWVIIFVVFWGVGVGRVHAWYLLYLCSKGVSNMDLNHIHGRKLCL